MRESSFAVHIKISPALRRGIKSAKSLNYFLLFAIFARRFSIFR